MKHTPEPWVIYGQGIDGPLDEFGDKQIVVYQVDRKEDARRIVACVNACAGVPTHELEQANYVDAYRTTLAGYITQRDQLLKALNTVKMMLTVGMPEYCYDDVIDIINESIEESMK